MKEEDLMEMIKKEYAEWFAKEPLPPNSDAFMKIALESFGELAYITGYNSAAKMIGQKLGIIPPQPIKE